MNISRVPECTTIMLTTTRPQNGDKVHAPCPKGGKNERRTSLAK